MKKNNQSDMKLTKDKLVDIAVKVLIVLAILHQLSAIITTYRFMIRNLGSLPQLGINFALFIVLSFPVLYIIGLIVSLIFIFKRKPWAYSITVIISGLVLYNAINSLIKTKAPLSAVGIIILFLWILLIALSWMRYYELKKKSSLKQKF